MLGNHSGCRAKGPTTRMIFQAFKVGCPIRRSMDQSSFAAPHGFSQRITSFIACACQGIHQMPLRHLIVLIANAHRLVTRSEGTATDRVTFYNPVNPTMPLTCSTGLLYGATPSSSLAACLKTSFSRLDPIPRGQATVIRSFIRRCPKATNNERSRVTSFLPTSSPSPISGRLGHPWDHQNWARTSWIKTHDTWKPPDQSSLHNVCRTRISS